MFDYHSSGHYPSSCLLLKIQQRFGDWILSSSSDGTTQLGPIGKSSLCLRTVRSVETWNVFLCRRLRNAIAIKMSILTNNMIDWRHALHYCVYVSVASCNLQLYSSLSLSLSLSLQLLPFYLDSCFCSAFSANLNYLLLGALRNLTY
jgi:hypothetical protein